MKMPTDSVIYALWNLVTIGVAYVAGWPIRK